MDGSSGNGPSGKKLGIFQWIWLVYLASPVYSILQQPVHQMWIGLAVLLVFIAANFLGYLDEKRRFFYTLLLTIIILYFCFYFDIGFWFMGFYVMPLVGLLPSTRQFYIGIASMLLLFVCVIGYHYHQFSGYEMVIFLPSAALMFGLPFLMRAGARAKELRAKLNTANEEIARLVKNEERQRISRDLHDTLGHTLSLITLKSELAEKLITKNPERAIQEVKDIQTTSRAALKQVRELVSGMNTISIQEELQHAEQLLSAAGIELQVCGDIERLSAPPLIQNMLGMCLREAITNVVKHSKAKHCKVELANGMGELTLTVCDDGIGANNSSSTAPFSGRGLLGMKERLELIEGKLELHTETGQGVTDGSGTRLLISVPRIMKGDFRG